MIVKRLISKDCFYIGKCKHLKRGCIAVNSLINIRHMRLFQQIV